MIRVITYSILSCILLFSCQSIEEVNPPTKILSEDQMADILTDIAFLKGAKTADKKVFKAENINPEEYVLRKHGVDSTIFAENNIWYSSQIDKYNGIFSQVKANLQKEKSRYEKLKKIKDSIKKVQDSIKKAQDSTGTSDSLYIEEDLEEFSEELLEQEEEVLPKSIRDKVKRNPKKSTESD